MNLRPFVCSVLASAFMLPMHAMGESEAANYIAALEKETNIEIIYVIYYRYYNLADKINDRRFHNKGIDHKYMPRKLQRYWSEVFRQNIELNINLDIELELSDSEKKKSSNC